jgi:invasion protein IalB
MMRISRTATLIVFGILLAVGSGLPQAAVAAPKTTSSGKQDREPPRPAGPQRIETVIYDSWRVICRDIVGVKGKKNCSAMLQVVEPKQKQVVFTWVLGYDNKGTLTAVFQTPVGVQLLRGLELKLGTAQARKVSFITCSSRVCEAVTPLNAVLLKEAMSAPTAVATAYAMNGRGVQFNINMKGFDKAIEALQQR